MKRLRPLFLELVFKLARIRLVISLLSMVTATGNGTSEDPYVIE